MGFYSLHQNAGRVFYSQKSRFYSPKNTLLSVKTINQHFGEKFKNMFCWKILLQICCFFAFFSFSVLKTLKLRFRPVFGVGSTQTLV